MTWRIFVEGWLAVIRLRLESRLRRTPPGPDLPGMTGA
jgi:hypothetical protein